MLLYFGALWCPPCRAFAPLLDAWAAARLAGASCALVFASADRDEASFAAFWSEMGGFTAAVPFGSPALASLKARFCVRGIPMLCLVERASGATLTVAARLLSQEHRVETPMPSRDLRTRSQNSYSISYFQGQETWFY